MLYPCLKCVFRKMKLMERDDCPLRERGKLRERRKECESYFDETHTLIYIIPFVGWDIVHRFTNVFCS